ncbi:DNA methyltransferase [uncultured Microscilla sp.]|uniref:DNA methyltransferase n=1 Tax=uncultured Microscilla sp. TaxID=432653 RepID=UPI0026226308|nr:DNA methyltransferase [uncultured Microscilla sp.]
MKQKRDRYEMHKYWGKKPSGNLQELIDKYTKEGDTVLDPFSGYGVFGCEAFIMNRNVILNDLNPIAHFLNKQLMEVNVDINKVQRQWLQIKEEFIPFVEKWYSWKVDGETVLLSSVLRDKKDIPLMGKYKPTGEKKSKEYTFTQEQANAYLQFEHEQSITDWYPQTVLLQNSRISAKAGMTVADLFTKRTLACHAKLLTLIEAHSSGTEKELFKVAFTANLANCSRLVPPIKSRGAMAPGAWMTGFYIGETYLENNVLTYFENRVNKIIKGKQDYLTNKGLSNDQLSFGQRHNTSYQIMSHDAKQLPLESDTVDYIFTDPPYGDAVPYFEQSIIWNAWLDFKPDYSNEIVISDSKQRQKNQTSFETDINQAFAEIKRVLKPSKYFSLTYHSLSGLEWKTITNACINNGFELADYTWLTQKSFTPRQINRLKSIKGDVLITLKKSTSPVVVRSKSNQEVKELFIEQIKKWLIKSPLDTNEIFIRIMKIVFAEKILIDNVDLLKILIDNFELSTTQQWQQTKIA